MSKLLMALSLAIVTTAAACGGDRMTVEEYATACEAIGETLNQSGNFDADLTSGFDAMEEALAEIRRWDPPEELQESHDVRVRSMDTWLNSFKETGQLDLLREAERAVEEEDGAKVLEVMGRMAELEDEMERFDAQMSALGDEAERAEENLSPETRQVLADANCF